MSERDDVAIRFEALQQHCDRITRQRDEARAAVGFTYCAYCGASFETDAPDLTTLVTGHINTCPEHPMRAVERERDEALRLAELRTQERDSFLNSAAE